MTALLPEGTKYVAAPGLRASLSIPVDSTNEAAQVFARHNKAKYFGQRLAMFSSHTSSRPSAGFSSVVQQLSLP